MRYFYFTNQLSRPVNLQRLYDFFAFKAHSNILNLQTMKKLIIYRVLCMQFTSLFGKFMIINVGKPIFFSSSIYFCRKFSRTTLYSAVTSCLTVLKREFFPIFITFMIVLIHIFQICNEYEMIFSPETEFFLKISLFFQNFCFDCECMDTH